MNQPLDNFFREKLEHAHKPAPPTAWDRIDAGLEGRQRKGLWLKIAAAVLIVAAASFILWPNQQDSDMQWVSKTEGSTVHGPRPAAAPLEKSIDQDPQFTPGSVKKSMVHPEVSGQSGSKPTHQEAARIAPAVALNTATPSVHKRQVQKSRQTTPAVIDLPGNSEPDLPMAYQNHEAGQQTLTEPVPEPVTPLQPAPASADVVLADADTDTEDDQAITLVYTAAEINAKYLDKEALEKATSAQKKPSTFRKLLDKAYDLKNNQDPMGGLRQKKNEILALNFKSEKRSQNK